ncbi:acetyl-CoA carboxylase biotin carboxyl carrier protein [Sabulicella glaciei]|uniref:Acetyl-CoA carboxylase biotin carboxyl carrier protein subunit n=1 Tax=Sabulicella glaciei TaxID=2984948 RepID=A0ABT3P0R5_9PROT|nr:hypothetical protein [Roseococcus sp. MDT2-1-1]MCW8087384.1 hypothetical protein [Roseococcus sp. MDT2-1-1]
MTAEEIGQITAWLKAAGLDSLELASPRAKLRLRLGAPAPAETGNLAPQPSAAPASIDARATGLFLPAHPWRATPPVQPGQRVQAGEIVGFLRIGPLLQPVTATSDGIVGRCLAAPGKLVGFGTKLFEFSPEGRTP